MKLCEICTESEKKYKCPKCEINYCSVKCFQTHECNKEKKLDFVIDTTPSSSNVEDGLKPTYLLEIPEEFILPLEKLEKLKESQELKQLLENPHLRDFLKYAHDTYNPSGFMKLAMKEPLFVEFSDACLKTIHPEDYRAKEITDQEIVQHISEAMDDAI